MLNSIFSYRNYKSYLLDVIASAPHNGRGLRQSFARAAGCQLPYVTHVLNDHSVRGRYDFSSEQIAGIADFLRLKANEKEFLLTLVQFQRAGTSSLKTFYEGILERQSENNSQLKERMRPKDNLKEADLGVYYSSWHFAAVHMLATIPEFQTRAEISDRLRIPMAKLDEVIDFLLSTGLIELKNNRLVSRQSDLHLEQKSPFASKHHGNWRLQAIRSLDEVNKNELHYSLAFSVARKDVPRVREILAQALERCAAVIRPSKEEELYALCLDLFAV